jgi:DNA-binding ferritin-like protein
MEKCNQVAAMYIATLRAISVIHQQNHWATKGEAFYGKHLLFERIYTSATEDLDLAAEKFIGVFDESCVNFKMQILLLNKVLEKYSGLSQIKQSLAIERDFIKFNKEARDCFEENDKLTLGLDDMIAAISSSRESAVYLLKQNEE